MNKKKLVSLGIAAVFLALGATGLLLYLVQHNKPTKVIHTTFGLFFVAVAVFHIINNWSSLVSYVKGKGMAGLNREFLVVSVLALGSVVGAGLMLPPFEFIEEFGEELRGGGRRGQGTRMVFNEIQTNQESTGRSITLQIEKGRDVLIPVIAVWAEDSTGNFLSNVFVPAKMMVVFEGEKGNEEHAIREGEVEPRQLDPAVLPTWSNQSKAATPNWQEATPQDNLIIRSKVPGNTSFTLKVEVSSLGKSEVYSVRIGKEGGIARLQGEGKMLKGFAESD
jgi:hypothetical protein